MEWATQEYKYLEVGIIEDLPWRLAVTVRVLVTLKIQAGVGNISHCHTDGESIFGKP